MGVRRLLRLRLQRRRERREASSASEAIWRTSSLAREGKPVFIIVVVDGWVGLVVSDGVVGVVGWWVVGGGVQGDSLALHVFL